MRSIFNSPLHQQSSYDLNGTSIAKKYKSYQIPSMSQISPMMQCKFPKKSNSMQRTPQQSWRNIQNNKISHIIYIFQLNFYPATIYKTSKFVLENQDRHGDPVHKVNITSRQNSYALS
jgi:hypothetical protein